MPMILEQVDKMSMSDKMKIMEYIMRSISNSIDEQSRSQGSHKRYRIGMMAGKWTLPSDDADRQMDEEIADMFGS